jgi:dolichol-phosphate mannosyltransferase
VKLSVIIPTCNEAPNVGQLIHRAARACRDVDAELIFMDDSTDDTPGTIMRAAAQTPLPVRMIHRAKPVAGLSGAVVEGMALSSAEFCVVMDGDLQHPPELIPVLLAEVERGGRDVVMASRYCGKGGSSVGLANWYRRAVSTGARHITRWLFPVRLRGCSDPMTGFFALRRTSVDHGTLQPSGFKILLEILATHRLAVSEIPFVFGERTAGRSKANVVAGLCFLRQVGALRVGTGGLFAAVGAVGAALNLLIMALMISAGANYVFAAIVAAELTIVSNFLLQENIVFTALDQRLKGWRRRFIQSFSFNNVEALLRLPVLLLAVDLVGINPVVAQAAALLAAFVLRYLYHARIVYARRPRKADDPRRGVDVGARHP